MKYLLVAGGKGAIITVPENKAPAYFGEVEEAFLTAAKTRDFCYWFSWPREFFAADLPVVESLAGWKGMHFQIIALPGTEPETIERAKAVLRANRDVVKLTVVRIKELLDFQIPG